MIVSVPQPGVLVRLLDSELDDVRRRDRAPAARPRRLARERALGPWERRKPWAWMSEVILPIQLREVRHDQTEAQPRRNDRELED